MAEPDLFDPSRYPRRLNLGCGFDIRDGYLNVDLKDIHRPDLVADVRELDMLPSNHYEEIVADDVLEHLPRSDTKRVLCEWCRLLTTGGSLKLRTTNVIGLLELLRSPAAQSVSQQEVLIQCLFGTQEYEGDYHLTGFTEQLLRHYLEEAGFSNIVFGSRDGWLFEVIAVKMRAEGVKHTPPSSIRQPLAPTAYRVKWISHRGPPAMRGGQEYELELTLENSSDATWPSDAVFISYHWLPAEGNRPLIWDGIRTKLPDHLRPGESVTLDRVRVAAPGSPGSHRLQLTLVHEDVTWFELRGASTLTILVSVGR